MTCAHPRTSISGWKTPLSQDSARPPAEGPGRPRIVITLGDPRGIGPEVTVRALVDPEPLAAEVRLVGPEGLAELEGRSLDPIGFWRSDGDAAEAGRLSYLAVERAVSLISQGAADAMVTAPLSKSALAAAGYGWPGHTEMLRDLTGVAETALCLAADRTPLGGALRVVLVTGHMALRQVVESYTVDRLQAIARLTHEGLARWWGLERPRLAICALNPHASDDGLFGEEEARVIAPALAGLRAEGIEADGPYPADTVFIRAMRGEADAVLAPYHDVGMAAIKTAAFGGAVNVTLGLPFPRTSPDHGTGLDIAGTGRADPSSMRQALETAVHLAARALTSDSNADKLRTR